jgi:Protein of unknown function, DUF417
VSSGNPSTIDDRRIAGTMLGWAYTRFFSFVSSGDRLAMGLQRIGLVVVLVWIGSLKFVDYEADSIVQFVANSPILRFVYRFPAPEYKHYASREGGLRVRQPCHLSSSFRLIDLETRCVSSQIGDRR